ncbi:MAG: hypothetical protein ACKVQU_26395 [Burkholderiales bacterium]
MTTHEMVERMLIEIEDDGEIDPFDLEIDDSMSEAELMVLLSQLPESESQTYSIH